MKRSPADLRGLAARARRGSLGVACLGCSGVCASHAYTVKCVSVMNVKKYPPEHKERKCRLYSHKGEAKHGSQLT